MIRHVRGMVLPVHRSLSRPPVPKQSQGLSATPQGFEYFELLLELSPADATEERGKIVIWLPSVANFRAKAAHPLRAHAAALLSPNCQHGYYSRGLSTTNEAPSSLSLQGSSFRMSSPTAVILLAQLESSLPDIPMDQLPTTKIDAIDSPDVGTMGCLGRVVVPLGTKPLVRGQIGIELGPGAETVSGHVVGVVVSGLDTLQSLSSTLAKKIALDSESIAELQVAACIPKEEFKAV